MSEASYSLMLRNLSSDLYHHHLDFDEYRAQRKIILDKIDKELNGRDPAESAGDDEETSSVFIQTVSFDSSNDIDQ